MRLAKLGEKVMLDRIAIKSNTVQYSEFVSKDSGFEIIFDLVRNYKAEL